MDRALKERIIGAVVLVAVVVLVVPVFLDGPPQDAETVSERITLPGQETDGTRTVVLDRDRSEPVPERDGEYRAASVPGGGGGQAPDVESAREEPSQDPPQREAVTEPDPETVDAALAGEAKTPSAPAEAQSEPEPEPEAAATAARSSTGMWAVQLGSFSNADNAERLAAELRQAGFAAFLSTLPTANGELHRVRVGPQRDREAAETMLARLKSTGQKGQVVPHP
jgi:DedD protein